jgi:site-specific recombinase XerD
MQENYKNELLKRDYEKYLKNAEGLSESTVRIVRRTLVKYDEFSKQADYGKFDIDKAVRFKEWLKVKNTPTTSYASYCKQMQKFLKWLAMQKGYKQKITIDIINYLKISNKEEALVNSGKPRRIPDLEYVRKLANSIIGQTEVSLRDRALVAFTCLTGMRDNAIASLPLKAFDRNMLVIYQNPYYGVKTKFTKTITSKIFNFDDNLLAYLLEWHKKLKEKGFNENEPLFPRSKSKITEGNLSYEPSQEVEGIFWQSGAAVRNVFKHRAEKAGLEYYPPHTYRHLAIRLALAKATNGEEFKAVSQNFEHKDVSTTLSVYGNYQQEELINKLSMIDCRKKDISEDSKKLMQIKKLLQ